jgi:peptide/nickel transport system substrate-binding protein
MGGRVNRRRRIRTSSIPLLVAAAVLLALGLVAGLASASSPAASPAAAKVVYRVGHTMEPDNLNPFVGFMTISYEVWYLTYEPLVGYDYGTLTPTKGDKATGLATDWSTSADGKTWTFTIRQNSKWNDGVPVTARDVAFTYNYIIENDLTNWTSYTKGIVKATAVDDTTVRIDCSQPKADMLNVYVPIIPEHVWSKVPGKVAGVSYPNKPPIVGSGPFTCVEWKKNSYVKMVANPDYWRGAPKIDELYFEYYTNADTMVQDLKAGTIDGAFQILDAQYRMLQDVPGIEARTIRTNGFDELTFNCYTGPSRGNPVLKDPKFRQALNWAVDKDKICAIAYGGHAKPATTVITADYYTDPDWHWEPPADEQYGFDLEKAKELLDAAGYTDTDGDGVREADGEPITLRLWCRDGSNTYQNVERLVSGWFRSIGLKMVVATMDSGALGQRIIDKQNGQLSPDYDVVVWGWYSEVDPGATMSWFTTDQIGSQSDCGYSNPEYDGLFVEQGRTIDPVARKALIDKMQQILYRDSPYIVLAYSNDLEAYNTAKWQGYAASPAKVGNVLIPPYGNAGSENYLRIEPKTGATVQTGGGNTGLWVGLGAAAVVIVILVVLLLRRRRPRAVEE